MKLMKLCVVVLSVVVLSSCSQNNKSTETNAAAERPKTETAKVAFASDKDFVCGMTVTADAKDTATVDGKLYGFCSSRCREKFVSDPKAYLKD